MNGILEFHSDNVTKHDFKLNIGGTKATPKARLVIPVSEGISLHIDGEMNNTIAKVTVPGLGNIIESNKIDNMKLEVIVDGTIHVPWTGSALMKREVKIVAEGVTTEQVVEEPQGVTVEATGVTTNVEAKRVAKEEIQEGEETKKPRSTYNDYI